VPSSALSLIFPLVYRSTWFAPRRAYGKVWALRPQQFVGHQRSITENVLEKTNSVVEAALHLKFVVLMCDARGIIIDRYIPHHSLSCNITSIQLTEQSPGTTKTIMTDLPTLDQAHFDELTQTVRGEVYRHGDHQYVIASVCTINRAQFLCPHSDFKSIHTYSMETF
jgi:hypothetical protein